MINNGMKNWLKRLIHPDQPLINPREERFRQLFEKMPDPVWIITDDRFVEANPAALEAIGYDHGPSFLHLHPAEVSPDYQPDGELSRAKAERMARLALDKGVQRFEWVYRRQDGVLLPVEVSLTPLDWLGQSSLCYSWRLRSTHSAGEQAADRGLNGLHSKESEIERLNRFVIGLSQVNQTLLRGQTREEIFQEICRVLVETGQVTMAWIGWVDEATHRVLPVASCGDTGNYLRDIAIYMDDRPEGRGPTGISLRTDQPVVCEDFATDPRTLPWRKAAKKSGWVCSASLPIHLDGKVCGALTLYGRYPGVFGPGKLELLNQAALNIDFALDALDVVRRQRIADEQLQQALERYRNMLSTAKDGFWLYDFEGNLLDVNDAAALMTGYSRDELLSMRIGDIDIGCSPDQQNLQLQKIVLSGSGIYETQHRTRDGKILDVEVSTVPDASSRTLVAFIRDITERKRLVNELRHTTERMEAMLKALPDLMFRVDIQGTIHEFHSSSPHLLYLEPHLFLGKKIADVLPEPAVKTIMDALQEAGTLGRCQGATYSLPKSSGEQWFELSVARMEESSSVLEFVMLVRDITQRRLMERQLLRLSSAVDQSVESIAITGLDARLEYVNEAFLRNTGFSREEVLGQNPRILNSGRTPQSTYDDLWSTLMADKSWHGEFINRRKDGSEYVEWASVSPLHESDGRVSGYIAVKLDITERKQAEADLIEARQRAEFANQAKTQFLAHMSHEIRTPMNAILGFAQILQHEALSADQHEMIGMIREAGDSLLQIINDILDLSKIEAGKLRIDQTAFTVTPLLSRVNRMMQNQAAAKGLSFQVEQPSEDSGSLIGDPSRIEQVLMNLASNAIKFTERGTVKLLAQISAVDPTTVRLRFEVHDTGIGIAPEVLEKLFQPFTQGDDSTTRRYGGTGLGLAISRRLVELMGGRIEATSHVGQGSIFWFELTLPLDSTLPASKSVQLAHNRGTSVNDSGV